MMQICRVPRTTEADVEARKLFDKKVLADHAQTERYYFDLVVQLQDELLREDWQCKVMPRTVREKLFHQWPGLKEAAFGPTVEARVRGAMKYESIKRKCGPKEAFSTVQRNIPAHCKLWSKAGYQL